MNPEYRKRVGGIEYYCTVSGEYIVCGESGQNPHGVNSEVRCTLEEFVEQVTEDAMRCGMLIEQYFGSRVRDNILAELIKKHHGQ